jgi:hypothetical protein
MKTFVSYEEEAGLRGGPRCITHLIGLKRAALFGGGH